MRWQGREKSKNVVDRRRGGTGRKVGAGIGIGTIVIVVLGLLMGGDPEELLQQLGGAAGSSQETGVIETGGPDDELAEFVAVVLKDTEDVWTKLFRQQIKREYTPPTLVLFSQTDRSACGFASAATGPFYCPADQSVYIDLSFFRTLQERFKAPGDFAMAYVIAHEVGHHVQYLLGVTQQVHQMKGKIPEADYNDLSVRLELQADYFSGLWAHHGQQMKDFLEAGDVEEALRAASAIGDDRLQMEAQGYVVPETFTHGTSEQRMRWFKKGFESGSMVHGDTFSSPEI